MTTAGSILNVLRGTEYSNNLWIALLRSTYTPSQATTFFNQINTTSTAGPPAPLTLLESGTAIGEDGNDMNFVAFNPVTFYLLPDPVEVSYLVIYDPDSLRIVGWQRVRMISGNQVQNNVLVSGVVTFDNIRVFVRSNTQ